MRVGTISQVWRYPVKSMGGERMAKAAVSWRGIPGDRGWAVYDETRSGITNGKRLAPLRMCRAHYPDEPVSGAASPPAEITFPDGAQLPVESTETSRRLSAMVGREVSFRALGPIGTETDPRLLTSDESPETIRELMGILPGEPEPDFSMISPERLRALRQGNFFDAFTIHLLTRTTLRTLKRIAPESDWDDRRFRPNLLVESDEADDYPELAWVGRRLRVGTARITVAMGCPRCVMVTHPEGDLPQDHRIMRVLVRETHHIAGIYASVAEEGVVREGDAIEVLD